MQTMLQDVRYALRVLRKHPAFTAVALVTLALGIGANTAIFSVVHTVLLRPLPFREPERLVQIWESRAKTGWNRASFTHANFWDVREMNRTFEDIGAFLWTNMNLTGFEYPEQLSVGRVSAGFFRVLGVQPVLGRTLLPDESDPGAENRVVLLGNELWRTRFGADSAIVGTSLTLNGESYTVVGVLPAGRPWLNYRDIFVPFVRIPEANRVSFELYVIGRVAPGVSLEAAHADLESVAARLAELYPDANAGMGITMAPASDWVASDELRRSLWVLFGAVGFLLMIACVNLANLLMAKATARGRETAVRTALGASRGRVAGQLLTESLLLGLIGAALGLLLALAALHTVRAVDPGGIPRLAEVGINPWVLGFTLLVGVFAAVIAGLLPALQAPRSDIIAALGAGDRGVAGGRAQKRLRSGLVAAEVALSLMLLVGAGLLIRSFYALSHVERGFRTENRLVVAVNLPDTYDGEATRQLLLDFLGRVSAIPQVRAAAGISAPPIVGASTGLGIIPAGQPDPDEGVPWALWRLVTGEYFRTMGIPLLRGRTFDERDVVNMADPAGTPPRVIISQRLAELLWPGEDALGRQAILWRGQGDVAAEVIGVVGSMRERGLDADPTVAVYIPYYGLSWSPVHFVFHTSGDPTAIVPTLRTVLADIDPNLPLSDIRAMDEIVNGSVADRRFNTVLLVILAGVALMLALAGIYGVQSYSVARRTSEIGVRVALGATHQNVVRLMVRQGMRPALLGIGLGILGALALSRLLTGLLFGIAPNDPLTYVGVALVLAAAALISCYVPALRALHLDPVTALREE